MNTAIGSNPSILLCDYYKQWITIYKEGAIRPITMNKYHMAHKWLVKLVPELKISELDRFSYQQLLNDYALEHERQTTMDEYSCVAEPPVQYSQSQDSGS